MRRAQQESLSRRILLDLSLVIMLGSFIGARTLHVLYEGLDYYLENPFQILMVWEGGFVFYGGAIGGLLGSAVFLRIRREDWRPWADLIAPVGAFGYGLGRLACFLNGCCYGKVCTFPWAVNFPHLWESRHPTQLYATFLEWGICLTLLFLERKKVFFKGTWRFISHLGCTSFFGPNIYGVFSR